MSSISEPGYRYRNDDPNSADFMREPRQGSGRVHLIIALLGMISLGYMLWTIVNMLGLVQA